MATSITVEADHLITMFYRHVVNEKRFAVVSLVIDVPDDLSTIGHSVNELVI